jgi:AbrB family looped-hinge helix DNA binding protein
MRTTIDGAGRIVIPKAVRERLGLDGGAHLEIAERDGFLEIRPVGRSVRLDRSGKRPVLRAPAGTSELTVEDVRAVLERTRR